jgi:VIT1/CCC1 family predicted Fe2+/Mn2+ transporter
VTRLRQRLARAEHRAPFVLGISDGLLNALLLSGHALIDNEQIGIGLALRVATFAAVSGAFAFFIAIYAEARLDLVERGRQLNLERRSSLATTALGRQALTRVVGQTAVASVCGFLGALIPMIAAIRSPLLALVLALVALGVTGAGIARATASNVILWVVGLTIGGIVMAALGIALHLT